MLPTLHYGPKYVVLMNNRLLDCFACLMIWLHQSPLVHQRHLLSEVICFYLHLFFRSGMSILVLQLRKLAHRIGTTLIPKSSANISFFSLQPVVETISFRIWL